MNRYTISIPKPCNEDWAAMTPEEKGRFCAVCQKTVVDFSAMDANQVDAFFDANAGAKVCGRFRSDQLSEPVRIEIPRKALFMQRSFVNIFLLALIVSMGTTLFSCRRATGEPAFVEDVVVVDSVATPAVSTPMPEAGRPKAAPSPEPAHKAALPAPSKMRIRMQLVGEVDPVIADTAKAPVEEPVKGKAVKSE